MSHAFAIVIVPVEDPAEHEKIAHTLELLLAPYSENQDEGDGEDGDPNRYWWDWYRVGGRWDGVIAGNDRRPGCAACNAQGGFGRSDHHYSDDHNQLAHNIAPVRDVGELNCFTLVTPEGEVRHRSRFVPDPGKDWPWSYEDDDGFDRWVMEQKIRYRHLVAVGVDYHS